MVGAARRGFGVRVSVAVGSAVFVDCGGSTDGAMSVGAAVSVGAAGGKVLVGGAACDPLVAVSGATCGAGIFEEHAGAITRANTKASHNNCRRNMQDLHVIRITVSTGATLLSVEVDLRASVTNCARCAAEGESIGKIIDRMS